jgi:hypothetical protein
MLELNDITLLTVNGKNPDLGIYILELCCRGIQFKSVKLISHIKPEPFPNWIEFEEIPHISSVNGYNEFCIAELHKHVQTPLSLSVQTDGFIIHPEFWDDSFRNYDYIGAVWSPDIRGILPGQPVGNSGFCMRSKRLLEETSRIASRAGMPVRRKDDLFACALHYHELVEAGMRFAPVEVASRFSFSMPVPGLKLTERDTFGFHGKCTRQTRELWNKLILRRENHG